MRFTHKNLKSKKESIEHPKVNEGADFIYLINNELHKNKMGQSTILSLCPTG